ncbi:MAG: S8 family serine peptidase [Thermomicrobiales bacterium]
MPVKVSGERNPSPAWVAAAILWSIAHGARVINISLKVAETPEMHRAIERAWDSGLVLRAAAGNY